MIVTPATPMSEVQAAWLAGLLDGEGCFDAPRNNPRIRVKMSDHDVVLRAADLMGASTYFERPANPDHKLLLVAQITGEKAAATMRALLPYLGARRSERATGIILAHSLRQAQRLSGARHLEVAA